MCGIAGIVGPGGMAEGVSTMVAALRHRGPDDRGCLTRGRAAGVSLGCARLAVLDLSPAGHLPMEDPATGNVLAYNGEVYNFATLRRELEAGGDTFRSGSDAEVVLRAYAKWGADALPRLRGMFALAVWDRARGEVLLARDRMGEKPLYYAEGKAFAFASEVRALLASGLIARRLDPAALDIYLFNGFAVSPLTLVRGVFSLPPGGWLRVDEEGRVRGRGRYWTLPAPSPAGELPRDALRARLVAAVEERLVSDVPLGAFLSGGIDSTIVVATMARAGGDVRTFSVGFEDPAYDESAHARHVAARHGTRHTEVRLGRAEFESRLPDAVAALDQPSFDGTNTYVVARAARENGLTVALTGAGADELFGGYPFFRQVAWLGRARRAAAALPRAVRGAATGWLAGDPTRVSGASKAATILAVAAPAGLESLADYQVAQMLLPDGSRTTLLAPDVRAAAEGNWLGLPPAFVDGFRPEAGEEGPDAVSRAALRLFLGERCLRDADATSMAVSLEVRAPFVDHLLVEGALGVPGRVRCRGVPDKPFEWELAAPLLGPDPTRRAKQGFLFPFGTWLREGAGAQAVQTTLGTPGLVEAAGLQPSGTAVLLEGFRQRRVPWSRVWALHVLVDWCARHRVAL